MCVYIYIYIYIYMCVCVCVCVCVSENLHTTLHNGGQFLLICNNIFEDVQKNSIQILKFVMYFLVVDYDTKPTLVPPFIFIEHIFLMVKFMCRKTCCKKLDEGNTRNYLVLPNNHYLSY